MQWQSASIRWRSGIVIAILAVGAPLTLFLMPPHYFGGAQTIFTILAAALGLLLLLIWLLFFSGLNKAARRYFALGIVMLGIALAMTVRVDGYYGDLAPRLVWRWTPSADGYFQRAEQKKQPAVDKEIELTPSPTDAPGFLGKNRVAYIPEPNVSLDWANKPPKELWRIPVGPAWSSFAIVGEWAFTQEQRGPDECVVCYHLLTGGEMWLSSTPTRYQTDLGGVGPRATPTVAEGRVFALGAMGMLTALDGKTGELLWKHDLVEKFKASRLKWGIAGSPLVVDEKVIVPVGAPAKKLMAFHAETGKVLWSGGEDDAAYSSPTLASIKGITQVVFMSDKYIAGHASDSGDMLWRFPWQRASGLLINNTQPLVLSDWPGHRDSKRIFVSSGYGKGAGMFELSLSDKGAWSAKNLWNSRRFESKFATMAVKDDYVYGLNGRRLICMRLADGKRMWRGASFGYGQLYLIEDTLLVQSESGELTLVAAKPDEYVELFSTKGVMGKAWNPPAFSDRYLILRSDREAVCYELQRP